MSSCDSISAEIAALRADIAALNNKFAYRVDINNLRQQINELENKFIPKSEKSGIISESVSSAKNLIVPIIGTTVSLAISPLSAEIARTISLANSASSLAANALNGAKAAAASAASALAKLAGIAAQIAAILGVIATLQVLGSRIDAIEAYADSLSNQISRLFGIITPIKSQAQRAEGKADSALEKIPPIDSTANRAFSNAQDALVSAQSANSKADTAISISNQANSKADTAISIGNQANSKADTAISIGNQANSKADNAISIGNQANSKADNAISIGNQANSKADNAISIGNQANSKADNALSRIGAIAQEIPGIKDLANSAKNIATQAKTAVTNLTNVVTNLQTAVNNILNRINNLTNNVVNSITNVVNNVVQGNTFKNYVTNNITNLVNNGTMNIDLSPVLSKLSALDTKIAGIPAATVSALVLSPSFKEAATSAAAAGTCRTMQPGGCSDVAMNRIGNNLSNSLFEKIANLFNTGANAAQLALLKVIDGKLGAQIVNAAGAKIGIAGGLLRIGSNTVIDRVLNLMGTAASIHNALMLSNDLGSTLASTIDMIINNFGIKDGNDATYSITSILGRTTRQFLEGLIGANNYTKLSEVWAKANRIYQASSNIFSSVRNMFDTTLNLTTTVANNTGKIGNKLREQGVINFDALPQFPENIQPNKFSSVISTLEKANEAASAISSIVSDVVSIQDDIKTIKENRDNLEKEFMEAIPKTESAEIKNTPVKQRDEKLDRDTQPPTISAQDTP